MGSSERLHDQAEYSLREQELGYAADMGFKEKVHRFRDRIDPERAEDAARAAGKSEAEVAELRRKALRRKRLLRSGGAGGGSFGG